MNLIDQPAARLHSAIRSAGPLHVGHPRTREVRGLSAEIEHRREHGLLCRWCKGEGMHGAEGGILNATSCTECAGTGDSKLAKLR